MPRQYGQPSGAPHRARFIPGYSIFWRELSSGCARYRAMSQEFQPGQIVPETGTYKVIHVPAHAGALNLVTVIKGRRFPDWQCCQAVTFELVYSFEAYRRDTAGYGRTARERRLSRKKRAVPFVARFKLIPAKSGRAIRAWAAGAGIAAAVLTLLAWKSPLK